MSVKPPEPVTAGAASAHSLASNSSDTSAAMPQAYCRDIRPPDRPQLRRIARTARHSADRGNSPELRHAAGVPRRAGCHDGVMTDASAAAPLPSLDELLGTARVVALPLVTRFRGIDVREAMLFEGPEGWTEFSPFTEYSDDEASAWL